MKRLIDHLYSWSGLKLHGVKLLESSQIFIADDVWTAIDEAPDHDYTADDFSNLSPVYSGFWIEAKSKHSKLIGGCFFQDITEIDPLVKEGPHGEGLRDIFPDVRWIYRVYSFAMAGRFMATFPGWAYIHVGENGEWLDDPKNVNFSIPKENKNIIALFESGDTNRIYESGFLRIDDFSMMLPMAFTTLSLLHSKQIETVDNIPRQAENKKWAKKTGTPMTIYKTLKVKQTRKEYAENGDVSIGDFLRRHHVRGHWRTYTDEAPLFGKVTGRIYVPAFKRGRETKGEVIKRYHVQSE